MVSVFAFRLIRAWNDAEIQYFLRIPVFVDMQPHEYSVEIQVEPINFDGKREETWFEVDSNQENDHQNYDYDNLIEDEELDTDNTAPVKSTKSKPPKKRKKAGNEKTYEYDEFIPFWVNGRLIN